MPADLIWLEERRRLNEGSEWKLAEGGRCRSLRVSQVLPPDGLLLMVQMHNYDHHRELIKA